MALEQRAIGPIERISQSPDDIVRDPLATQVPESLENPARQCTGRSQSPRRGVPEPNDLVPNVHFSGWPVRVVHQRCRDLCRQPEQVRRVRPCQLKCAPRRPRHRSGDPVEDWSQRPQARMDPRMVVDPPSEPADLPGSSQARKRLVHSPAAAQIQEIRRYEYRSSTLRSDPGKYLIENRFHH